MILDALRADLIQKRNDVFDTLGEVLLVGVAAQSADYSEQLPELQDPFIDHVGLRFYFVSNSCNGFKKFNEVHLVMPVVVDLVYLSHH